MVIPTLGETLAFKILRRVSSTTAELHGLKQALQHIENQMAPTQWVIFTDSRAALQALKHSTANSSNPCLILDILATHATAKSRGHDVVFQWVPGHSGLQGNEAADKAAAQGHLTGVTDVVPFTKSDTRALIRQLGKQEFQQLWQSPAYHYKPLYAIDPFLHNALPCNLPRNFETLLHRLRLNATYTNIQRHKFGLVTSPNCQHCGVPEDNCHIFYECELFDEDRQILINNIQELDNKPFSLERVLGSWDPPRLQQKAIAALEIFLQNTGLIDRL